MSTTPKHTPGPWTDRFSGKFYPQRPRITDLTGEPVAECYGREPMRRIANARLIAAAPDLLAALECAMRCPGIFTTDQVTGETFDTVIRAALAKVTA